MRNKKQNGIKLPETCPCGSLKIVKKIGEFWSCQRCLDMDKVVNQLHERARPEYMMLTQDEALEAYYNAKDKKARSYYKNFYMLQV